MQSYKQKNLYIFASHHATRQKFQSGVKFIIKQSILMLDTLDISKVIQQAVNCWYFHLNNQL